MLSYFSQLCIDQKTWRFKQWKAWSNEHNQNMVPNSYILSTHFPKHTWNTVVETDRRLPITILSLFSEFLPGNMAIPNKELHFPASFEGSCGHLTTCWLIGYKQKQYTCTEGRAQVLSFPVLLPVWNTAGVVMCTKR